MPCSAMKFLGTKGLHIYSTPPSLNLSPSHGRSASYPSACHAQPGMQKKPGSNRKERQDVKMSFYCFCLVFILIKCMKPNKMGRLLWLVTKGVANLDTRAGNLCLLLYNHQKQWPDGDLLQQDTEAPFTQLCSVKSSLHHSRGGGSPPFHPLLIESSFLALEYSWTLYCPFVLVPALSFSLNGLLGVFVTSSIRHNPYQPSFSSAAQAKLFSLFLYSIINHQLFN